MRILFLTQYFPPETGAPQNRLFDLAQKLLHKGAVVNVLTAFPNYPQYEIFKGYSGHYFLQENMDGIRVFRSWVYVSAKKSVLFRLLNYFSFTFSSLIAGLFKAGPADIIICESPPLFLGFTAVLLKWAKGARLVFNVSDLWPESAVKLGIIKNPFLIKLSTWLENWIYKQSDYISGQTQGIVKDIQNRVPNKQVYWLPNGVDTLELNKRLTNRNWRAEQGFKNSDRLFYFGGLLGYAQGLDCIVEAAATLLDLKDVKFIIIGDGPEKDRLVQLKNSLFAENVFFFNGVPKSEIADVINAMDVAIIPLKKLDLFLGAIPSKIFEILALGKPMILGIDGEAKTLFIEQANAGLFFEPENAKQLAEQVRVVLQNPVMLAEYGKNGAAYVAENFDRKNIADAFYDFITQNQ